MKTVPVEPLTLEKFQEIGGFRDMLNPVSEMLGAPPIEFFPDMIQQVLGNGHAVFHLWDLAKLEYPWPTNAPCLSRNFVLSHYDDTR